MNRKIYMFSVISFLALIFIFNPVTEKLIVKADETDSLQILKNDRSEDGGIKEESKIIYDESEAFLDKYTEKNSGKLEVELVGVIDEELILLAINETSKPIKNLSFDLSLEGLFENKEVEAKQNSSGTLDAGNIYPIKLNLSEEEIVKYEKNAPYSSIDVKNIKIENVSQANFWKYFVLNLIFSIIAYKLGFARELPFKKEIFVYIMLAVGVYVLTIFSLIDLPITESLIIVSLVLAIYRYRLHLTRKKKAKQNI